jgi:serine/tyrosine/threonine adenylyltransferase
LHVGFIHGVMNTDNCTVSGETIDFGPCAFMDAYDANKVFSSIDQHGRYAYSNQPSIAQWNLVRLAETLLPLIDVNEARAIELATESINAFAGEVDRHWLEGMRAKLGLRTADPRDPELAQGLLAIMQRTEADFTLTFRSLCSLAESNPRAEANDALNVAWLGEDSPYAAWLSDWRARCAGEPLPGAQRAAAMRAVNPKFIPRNHRIEELIEAAVEREDFSLFDTLLSVLAKPFDEQPQSEAYAVPPRPEQRVAQTFCGT